MTRRSDHRWSGAARNGVGVTLALCLALAGCAPEAELPCCFDQVKLSAEIACMRDRDSTEVQCVGPTAADRRPRADTTVVDEINALLSGVHVSRLQYVVATRAIGIETDGRFFVANANDESGLQREISPWFNPDVPSLEAKRWRDVFPGYISCGIDSDGVLQCHWPYDEPPKPAMPEGRFSRFGFGSSGESGCAVAEEGDWRCWGSMFDPSEREDRHIGKPDFLDELASGGPRQMLSFLSMVCAVRQSGAWHCEQFDFPQTNGWHGAQIPWYQPAALEQYDVPTDVPLREICVGVRFMCQLDEEGQVTCWGDQRHPAATSPPEDLRFEHIECFDGGETQPPYHRYACGLTADGELGCWGDIGHMPETRASHL